MNQAIAIMPESIEDPRVAPVAKEVTTLTDQVDTFEVGNANDYEHGAGMLMTIKALSKDVESKRKKITQPLDQAKQEVMDLFRPLTDALSNAERKVKQRLVAWKSEQDQIARENQRKADERARKERDRLQKQADEADEKGRGGRAEILRDRAATTIAVAPPTAAPKVAGISTRPVWKFEIVDASKVPDQYKTVDEKKIGGVVRALKGDTDIPGVRVWEESTMAARSA